VALIDPDRPCVDEYVESIILSGDDDLLEAPRAREVGVLEIRGSDAVDLQGLGGCLERAHEVRITDNAALESLAGLDALQELVATEPGTAVLGQNLPEAVDAKLVLSDNPVLVDLAALGQLRRIEGDLIITANEALMRTDGLAALEVISGGVVVEENSALVSISLPTLFHTGEPFEVRGNSSLLEVGPFGPGEGGVFVSHGRLFGGLVLEDNEQLSTIGTLQDWSVFYTLELRQLPKLAFIPDLFFPVPFSDPDALDVLVVEGCDSLVGLDGLGRLSLGGQVVIRDNDALEGLSGLEQLERARLVIHSNAELRFLAAIDLARDGALDGAPVFQVTNNPTLASCEAESVAVNLNPQNVVIAGNEGEGECPWL